ncbi:stage III sporulation protein AF, partial [Caenibacillus caldisaponilyticus]|uniref:stage III sporulation protein AF n=1 Tax=Caenibacillus caldisaponilyticus TaxID=1674942 RepID=UPI0011789585
HYTIVSIDVTVDDHPEDPVKKVAVVLGQAKSDSEKTFEAVQPIEAVRVNVSKDSDASEEPGAAQRMEDVRNFLAKTWGVRPERIAVRSEEGGRG